MAQQLKAETAVDAKQRLRAGLSYVTQQLIIAECDLQRAELAEVQNKISQLTNQAVKRRERSHELVGARVNELLNDKEGQPQHADIDADDNR